MSAPSRRKKVKKPVSNGRTTFKLVIDAQEMVVEYTRVKQGYMSGLGQFIFRSPHQPPRRIPLSETGYRSYFAAMEDVEASESPQQHARDIALALLRSQIKGKVDRDQLPLF